MWRKVASVALALAFTFVQQVHAEAVEPYVVAMAKNAKHCKAEGNQSIKDKKWITFAGCDPFVLGGDRALFFAQLHLTCTKRPRYVKIRLARLLPNGKKDTTGTNTWVLGANAPLIWEGTTYWESKTKYPIVAQFKVRGGKCYSDERQIKYWQP